MVFRHNIFLLLFIKLTYAQDAPIVNTTQGLVRGLLADNGNFYKYMGIPFAEVDPLNPFGPSLPGRVFEDIFNATDGSAICPQIGNDGLIGTLDCLHLSVYVPTASNSQSHLSKLPVLIFIYGGSFIRGYYGIYDGRFLVRHDIIVVTFNYRVGPFGFMCTDNRRVPGNQASKDQLMALRWVRDNIENFGGDPNRVTLSGNSAGGMTSDLHVVRDSEERLFHQLILQSGSSNFPSFPTTVRNSPLILADHFGLDTNDIDEALDFLATIEPLKIIDANRVLGIAFRPCIERLFDGVEPFLTENWVSKEIIKVAKDLKLMIGFNQNEALGLLVFPDSDVSNVVNEALREGYVVEHDDFNSQDEVRHFFFGDEEINGSQLQGAIDVRSDMSFVYTTIRTLNRYLNSGIGQLYLYLFSYDGKRNLLKAFINTTIVGAVHADEVGYLYDVPSFGEPNEDDQLIVDRMTEMWANFVKYGDPTPKQNELLPVKWPSITPSSPHYYMNIGSELKVNTRPFHERIAFWDVFHEINKNLQRFIIDNADM